MVFSFVLVLLFGRYCWCSHWHFGWNVQAHFLGSTYWQGLWKAKEERQTSLRTSIRWVLIRFFVKSDLTDRRKVFSRFFLIFSEKQIDLNNVDLKKLKVRDLKKILNDWDETCDGCLEKADFIKRIEELKPKHLRNELWELEPSDNFCFIEEKIKINCDSLFEKPRR